MTEPGRPMLEVTGVVKRYGPGPPALAEVDLTVRVGETVALIGESGCGKTTLLRLFNRMVEPTAGEVRVAGRRVDRQSPVELRRRIGYVQQEGGLIPHWTVRRNVELVPRLLGWSRNRRRARVAQVLEMVGLETDRYGDRYPRELSGGEGQRVAIARSLAADPEVILLDEPFGALDALTRLALQEEFLELKRRLRKTMILVTHDLAEAFRLGDRIGVMRQGRILRLATPQELAQSPGDPYVASLIRAYAAIKETIP